MSLVGGQFSISNRKAEEVAWMGELGNEMDLMSGGFVPVSDDSEGSHAH